MIQHIFNWGKFSPILRKEFLNMAKDTIAVCEPDEPYQALAIKLHEWIDDWLKCREIKCCVVKPLIGRRNETFYYMEGMFQSILVSAVDSIDWTEWLLLAQWWIKELEENSPEDIASVQHMSISEIENRLKQIEESLSQGKGNIQQLKTEQKQLQQLLPPGGYKDWEVDVELS